MQETSLRALLGLAPGPVDLRELSTTATPGAPKGRDPKLEAATSRARTGHELADLQEQLFGMAETEGSPKRLLLVLQGMDTSGKDGAIKRGLGGMNPKWMQIKGFEAPTKEEQRHPFLWRIEREVPQPGIVGVFDRSHYEDVLVVRVRGLAPEDVWRPRYEEINAFERRLTEDGVTIVKVFLHISREYQRERQIRRLERVDKRWKFNEGDLDDRDHWDEYRVAYEEALERCNTPWAPWHVVPADRKWYRMWAVSQLVRETMRGMDLHYPERRELDIPALITRLNAG
jgi:PPK2 family polyphosphate:nucleotide phosphotransferase